MKKILSTITMLAVLAGTASAAGYVLPPNQPGALTPVDWQPTYNIEGLYAKGEHHAPDMWGVRGSLSLYSNGDGAVRHQFSINVAGEIGSDSYHSSGEKIDQDAWMIPITAGYDMNIGLSDSVFLDLGAKGGWATGEYKEKWEGYKASERFNGLTVGFGAGLKIICGDRIYVKAGYEFNRTFTSDDLNTNINQHVIVLGIGSQF